MRLDGGRSRAISIRMVDRMHVLILNQYALPAGAAGITRHGDIGAELVRRGHDVTVIASDFDYLTRRPRVDGERQSRHDGVQFMWLRTGAYTGNDRRRVRSMIRYATAAAWAAIRLNARPDVIVGSSPHLLAGASASVVARLLRRPWIFEVRDFWPSALVDLGAISRGGIVHRSLERVERRLYVDAAAVVTVPPNGSLRLAEFGIDPAKCVHIPNASAWNGPPTARAPTTVEEILDSLRGKFVVVYSGQLGVTHDLHTVLLGLDRLRSDRPSDYGSLAVLLIGDGVERDRVMRTAGEFALANVHFHSAIEKAAIPQVLSRADACLMHTGPSDYFKYGLSPNKLFDYFAAGKPVLISSAYPTVVDEADAGIRFAPGDPEALAAAIVRMMQLPPDERVRMGERGRELVRTRYSTSAIADQYEALLEEVISRQRR
jgi:glycosyltransferase involved in cell wall biosynthesis